MQQDIVTLTPEIPSTSTMSRNKDGTSLVSHNSNISFLLPTDIRPPTSSPLGNYDVTKLHYEGPGNVPGATGGGYGYSIRTEGISSSDAPAVAAT